MSGVTSFCSSAPATVKALNVEPGLVGGADRAVLARVVGRVAGVVGVDLRPVREREDAAVARVHDDRGGALGLQLLRRPRRAPPRPCPGWWRRASGAGPGRARSRLTSRSSIASPSASFVSWRSPSTPLRSCRASTRARTALVVGADDAEQLRGHPLARVDALELGDELEPLDLAAPGRGARRRRDVAGEVDEAGVAAGERRRISSSGLSSSAAKLRGDSGGVLDQVRRRGDRHRRLRDRELGAIAVDDRAAAGGDDDVGLLLGRGGLLERAGLDDAEPGGPGRRSAAGRGRRRRGSRCGARSAALSRPVPSAAPVVPVVPAGPGAGRRPVGGSRVAAGAGAGASSARARSVAVVVGVVVGSAAVSGGVGVRWSARGPARRLGRRWP